MKCQERLDKLNEPCAARCVDSKKLPEYNMVISHNEGRISRFKIGILQQVQNVEVFKNNYIRHGHVIMSQLMAKECKEFNTLNGKNIGMDHTLGWNYKFNCHPLLQKYMITKHINDSDGSMWRSYVKLYCAFPIEMEKYTSCQFTGTKY